MAQKDGTRSTLILILVLIALAAGGYFAWSQGWFSGGGPAPAKAPAPAASDAPPASGAPAASNAPAASDLPPSEAPPEPDQPGELTEFTFNPPGELHGSGAAGVSDTTIYVPGMRFPMEVPKAFANSQVYGHGGFSGPGGGQCDAANFGYPWSDNFCETRGYSTPLCPSGKGHQGQDIRPGKCKAGEQVAVAAEAGTITQIGTYTVYLSSDTGRTYLYLHMKMNALKVGLGDRVTRGQPLGLVSNDFGATPTTIHLHFEIKQPVTFGGSTVTTRVPPYSSLVDAYQRMLGGTA